MLPDLDSLALFVQAAEMGNLTRAAEASHITVPAASRRLSLLEHQFKAQLFERHSRGLQLTPAGEHLLQLTREVIGFERAIQPLGEMADRLMGAEDPSSEEHRYLRDVHDHAIRLGQRVDGFRELLDKILQVNLTLEAKALAEASNEQTIETKKISAWAAIIFAPTLVGTIYGMNFDSMPELAWEWGYPFAIILMVVIAVVLYVLFKRRRWI